MRCPKCHYISFDSGDRCRNCGYDFSLTVDVPDSDLPLATKTAPEGPLGDFALEAARTVPARAPDTASELPLFTRGGMDRPLAAVRHASGEPVAPPRAPLAVRRSSPAPARERVRMPEEPTLDLEAPDTHAVRRERELASAGQATADSSTAPMARRSAAALIDLVLIASIHAGVIYLTLRLCGLTTADVRVLPPVPLGAFLLMLAAGYLISFTVAGGQTIGKMATGVRVVPNAELDDRDPARVTLGCAVVRAAGCLVSILTAGMGYVPALVSQDHRALHDRLADTRVVRA